MPRRPWNSPLFFAGLGVWMAGLTAWLVLWGAARGQAVAAAATLGAFLVAGKIAGVTAGLALQGSPLVVALSVFTPDFGTLLFFHPFSQTGIDQLGRWNRWVGGVVARARARHASRDGFLARHGAWGLFLIALVPVGFYSPLVVAAIGEFAGIRARNVVLAVGSAMAITTTAWLAAFALGLRKAGQFDPRLPFLIGISVTLLFLVHNVVKALLRRRAPGPAEVPLTPDEPRSPP